jgi:hypothetical protein
VLNELKALAAERGGRVLSKSYLGTRIKLKFRCASGHEWEALPDTLLKKRNWCRACSMNWLPRSEQLEALKAIARSQGGEVLSHEYVSCRTKVQVSCAKGHAWSASPSKLKQGRWCPVCHYDRLRTYRDRKRLDIKAGRSKAGGPVLM